MQTPLLHVNYKEYYGRFFRQFLRDLFKLESGQVIGALSTIAILIFQLHYGLIPRTLTVQAFASIGWPYGTVVVILCLLSAGRAPAVLDAECQKEIGRLNAKLDLPDKAKADHVRYLLALVSEDAKNILRLAMHYDFIETQQIFKNQGLSWDALQKVLQECKSADLLRVDYEVVDPSSMLARANQKSFWHVQPEFRETLRRLLYSVQEKAG
jgi:hypothetical protein